MMFGCKLLDRVESTRPPKERFLAEQRRSKQEEEEVPGRKIKVAKG